MEQRELTFGEKAVGITFNPSFNPKVDEVKALSAKIIDTLNEAKIARGTSPVSWTTNVLFTAAFNAVIAAQMAVVKYITWND